MSTVRRAEKVSTSLFHARWEPQQDRLLLRLRLAPAQQTSTSPSLLSFRVPGTSRQRQDMAHF